MSINESQLIPGRFHFKNLSEKCNERSVVYNLLEYKQTEYENFKNGIRNLEMYLKKVNSFPSLSLSLQLTLSARDLSCELG